MRRSRGEEQQEQSSERGYRHDAEKLFLSLGASQYPPDGGNVRGGDNDGTQHQRHKPGSPDAQPLGDPFPALLRYGCRRYKVREEHRLNPPGQLHQAALQDHLQPTGQTGVYYSIDQFCKDLEIPASYSNAQIDQKVLRPAQTRIKESEADVWFDYKFICKTPKKGQKPKADTIILFIHARNPQELRGDQQQQYSFVYRWVYGALSYPSDNTPVRALDKILESGRLKDVYDRCAYYDDKVCSGEMSTAHAQNSLAKMLREDFGIKARGKKKDPDLFG